MHTMRVLQIGSDRSKRGILYPESPATRRQDAYGERFGELDIIGFSLRTDERVPFAISPRVSVYPSDSASRLRYGIDALRIARGLTKPDVVSVQDPFETGFVGWLVSLMKKAPLHVQVHTDFLSPAYARHSTLNRMRVWIAGFVLRRAKRVRVVSERIKESIDARYALRAPITVLPIFVDVARFRTPKSDFGAAGRFITFGWRILVVSRLEPEKDVALAIRAFAQAAPDDACLIVVGGGSGREALERLARELNISHHVFFEGEQDAAPYYALADLVLVPSRYEGYGLVIVEALASGKPVLSTDVGIAREAGAIVVPREQFAEALAAWFRGGPRTASLQNYPYKDFDGYVRAYCDDIASCIEQKKGHTAAQ
jgi:glycosyltransferase involved in cell wall biosynthesis